MKILHVDDEPDILEQAKIFLEKEVERLNVETVTSAGKALDLMEENSFDAVVADYQMPEMDGLEFLEVVREERNSEVPFIIFTGKGREEVAMEALNLGADRYLRKGGSPKSQYGVLAQAVVQEVKRRRSEEWHRKLIECNPETVAIIDKDGEFLIANPTVAERLDHEPDELIGKNLREVVSEEVAERRLEMGRKAIEKGGSISFEDEREGRHFYNIFSPLPVSGDKEAFLVVATEITEQEEMEETVQNVISTIISQIGSDDLFQQIVDSAREVSDAKIVALSTYDREEKTLKTKAISGAESSLIDRVSDIFGLDNLLETEYSVEDVPRFEKFSERKEREPLVLDGLQEYTFGMFGEKSCKLVEKMIGIEEIVAIPLLNSDRNLVGILGYLFPKERRDRNYTPLKIFVNLASQAIEKSRIFDKLAEAREELEEREYKLREGIKRYRKLTEASPDAILLVDAESGEITDANKEAENLFGMPREKVIGKNLSELRPEEEEDWYRKLFSAEGTEPVDTERPELYITDSDGNEIPVEIGTSKLKLEGRKLTYGVFRDITERKKAEERENFLHSLLRHDVRNKVRIIQGYHELMEDFDMPQEAKRYLSKAKRGLKEGMDIIEKVRSLREAQEEEIVDVKVESAVKEAVEQAEEIAKDKGMEIEVDCPGQGSEVRGGPLLNRVFTNILENATQHSEGSKVKIHGETSGEEVTCIIEDDGNGISDEKKEMIFKKGYTTDEERGTGLGMFLVKTLLEIYGGSIEVKDSELGGTRFDVRLNKA